jgi:hypothetical protein
MQILRQIQYKLPKIVHEIGKMIRYGWFALCWGLIHLQVNAQVLMPDTLLLDTLAIRAESVQAKWDTLPIPGSDYRILPYQGKVILAPGYDYPKIKWTYRTYPIKTWVGQFGPYYTPRLNKGKPLETQAETTLGSWNGIQTNGYISRGVQIGNNQNLNVQSGMNLELNGKINQDWNIKGVLSDANIPLQPGGTSARLEDFDQIFISLYNAKNNLVAGDFFSKSWDGEFMRYNKRSQGLKYVWKEDKTHLEIGTSVSKGRFARQVIQGIEGNQGPYRLQGAQGETYILVLAGTESVYIDGVKLSRGQDKDYIIDYNAGLLTFMPTRLITKDKRITVEFQYSDKQYVRPLITTQLNQQWGSGTFYVRYFNESDAKNQPLQLNLGDSLQYQLSQAGDNLNSQYFDASEVVTQPGGGAYYRKIDTLAFQGVWQYSLDTTQQLYNVSFSYVGLGNGDYKESGFTASGKIYQWVSPIWDGSQWLHQGDYIDKALLNAPKRLQLLTAGWKDAVIKENGMLRYQTEWGASIWDQNTFSKMDDSDNQGYVGKSTLEWRDSLRGYAGTMQWEYQSSHFQRVERFREVEFERNWNILGLDQKGNWNVLLAEGDYKRGHQDLTVKAEYFSIDDRWSAHRERWKGYCWKGEHLSIRSDGWFTESAGLRKANYVRSKDWIEYKWKRFRVYYQDEWERNRVSTGMFSSYAFLDYSIGVGTVDTLNKKLVVFYRNRLDQLPDSNGVSLASAAQAEQWGLDMGVRWNSQNRLSMVVSQRKLQVLDMSRFTGQPENTVIGKVGYQWKDKKQVYALDLFYQIGSGLEQRRSYVYIEVPAGQGSFVWVDYNDNGIKELNEFEVPAFGYEANFIRTQVPTSDFIQVGSTLANLSFQWRPQSKGWNRFSNLFNVQSDNKQQAGVAYAFWDLPIGDTSCVQATWMLRDQLQFNLLDPKWGFNIAYQKSQNKNGLSLGYEWRREEFISPQLRWNLTRDWSVLPSFKRGWKTVESDFLLGRNYSMHYQIWNAQVNWKPQYLWTLTLSPEWVEKQIVENGLVQIARVNARVQYRSAKRTAWVLEGGYHSIQGTDNQWVGSLQYDVLEGLQLGYNYTWGAQLQTMSGKLQWSLVYNGRKANHSSVVHTGMLQVKAVF